MVRFSRFVESLTVTIMKPDDLIEFSRQTYNKPRTIEAFSQKGDVDQGLDDEEVALLDALPKKVGKLLLLGVGGGREAIYFARMGFTVTGVDFCPRMTANAQANAARHGLSIGGLVQEISQLVVPANSYDTVWLGSAMYSSVPTRTRRVKMLKKIKNGLFPGGYFVCTFFWHPNLRHSRKGLLARKAFAHLTLGNRLYEPGDMLLHNIEFIHAFSSEESIRSEFTEGGFKVIQFHTYKGRKRAGAILIKPQSNGP